MPLRVSCPGPLLRLACLGGGCPVPVPPYLAWGCGGSGRASPGGCLLLLRRASGVRRSPSPDCPPTGRAVGVRDPRVVGAGVRVWGPFSVPSAGTPCGGCAPRGGSVAFVCRGAGWGGGGGLRRTPWLCGRGGAVGRGVALPHSVPLPSLGRQQSGCHWRCAVHGGRGPPYHSGSCSPGFSGCALCGVLARWRGLACSSRPPWEPAAGAGGRVALRLLSRAGGGPSPLPRGVGARAPAACGPVGGRGGGGCRAAASLLPFWAAACGTQSWPPSCRRRAPSRRARAVGVEVPPRRGGGARGGPWTAPPGALADLNPPSALPEWAVWSCGSCGSCGARRPYCSVVRVAPTG